MQRYNIHTHSLIFNMYNTADAEHFLDYLNICNLNTTELAIDNKIVTITKTFNKKHIVDENELQNITLAAADVFEHAAKAIKVSVVKVTASIEADTLNSH